MNSDLPWSLIHDFLIKVGAESNLSGFCQCVITNISTLVPFDVSSVFVMSDPSGIVVAREAVGESQKWLDSFNQYYYKTLPAMSIDDLQLKTVDWSSYRDSEYVTDFLQPQGIGYSCNVLKLGRDYGPTGSLILNRSFSDQPFTAQEQMILKTVQPHLSNYYAIFTALAVLEPVVPGIEEIRERYPCLTRREAEIGVLLCRKYSTGMIGTSLLISSRTVHKHIENIFDKLDIFNRNSLVDKLMSPSQSAR